MNEVFCQRRQSSTDRFHLLKSWLTRNGIRLQRRRLENDEQGPHFRADQFKWKQFNEPKEELPTRKFDLIRLPFLLFVLSSWRSLSFAFDRCTIEPSPLISCTVHARVTIKTLTNKSRTQAAVVCRWSDMSSNSEKQQLNQVIVQIEFDVMTNRWRVIERMEPTKVEHANNIRGFIDSSVCNRYRFRCCQSLFSFRCAYRVCIVCTVLTRRLGCQSFFFLRLFRSASVSVLESIATLPAQSNHNYCIRHLRCIAIAASVQ